jgi:hypothetical protein
LTTEQIANAGARNPATAERRSFEGEGAPGGIEPPPASDAATQPLLPEAEAAKLRSSWDSIQAGFVDEPRRAVQDADHLVAQAMQRLAEMFAEERGGLESQWDRGDDVSTEDLRIALQRYRAFFGRLLAV